MTPITLDTETQVRLVAFGLACYIEDTEKELRKRKLGKDSAAAKQLAELQRLLYLKIIPGALCGRLVLADGRVIEPGQEYIP